MMRRAGLIFEVLGANLSLNSKKFYVRDKEITRKMGACTGAVLVGDTDFCPGRKLERETLQLFAKNGFFGEKLGILAGLSPSFDHFMAIFGTFCKFLHWPISLF